MSYMVRYRGYIEPMTPPEDVVEKWRTTLLGRRILIYERIHHKIPDVQSFVKYLATPAYYMWSQFMNPQWFKADIVGLKFHARVAHGGPKFLANVYEAFIEKNTFGRRVNERVGRFAMMVAYPLGGVGIRYLAGWGPEYKAIGVLTGDARVVQYIGPNEIFEGKPVIALEPHKVVFFRPTLIALLTQGVTEAQYALETGMTDLMNQIINLINEKVNEIISAVKRPEFAEVFLGIGFDAEKGKLYVEAYAR